MGQLLFADNRSDLVSSSKKNLVVSRTPSNITSVGSIDSSIKYVPFEKTHSLHSAFNVQAGLGMEVELFQKNRFSLSASALLQLSMTRFKYSYVCRPAGDTLTYMRYTLSPPLANATTDVVPEHKDLDFLKINAGVYPGLTIRYRLTNRIETILKPGVFIDLKELRQAPVNYSQHAVFVTAGLRIRL